MNVIIPTAGLGTRLRPHTHTKPKPMVHVAGQPVLGHLLERLQVLPIDEMVFIIGHLGEHIEEYVRQNYSFRSHFIEQKELKGQAHAISLVKGLISGPTVILFVDTIFDADLTLLNRTDADGVIYVSPVEDPARFGVVIVEEGRVTRLVEKPSTPVSNLAVIGLYYIREVNDLFDAIDELIERNIQTKGEYYLADALQLLIDKGKTFISESVTVWEDCGTPEALLQTNRYLLEHGQAQAPDQTNALIIQPVYIAPTATIINSVIGPYASIADGAVIRDAIIRDSIVSQGASIASVLLEYSIIGDHARVKGDYERLNVGDSSVVQFG